MRCWRPCAPRRRKRWSISVGSGEEYGPPESVPTTEDAPLRPQNPYAVSKASSGLLARFYADAHGLRVIHARAFNHAGPGQEAIYAIANFARQFAEGLDAGEDPVRVVTGSPDTRRDFTDVRDVVQAYRALAERAEPGTYNVCSGVSRSARELVAALADVAGVAVDHEVDPAKVRAHEVFEIRGSAERLHAATGWTPQIPLEQTLADTLAAWRRAHVSRARAAPVAGLGTPSCRRRHWRAAPPPRRSRRPSGRRSAAARADGARSGRASLERVRRQDAGRGVDHAPSASRGPSRGAVGSHPG